MNRPRLLQYLQVVRVGDCIHLHGKTGDIWEVTGGSVNDLAKLVPYLDGNHSVTEAAYQAGIAPDLAAQMVDYLQELNLVAEGSGIPESLAHRMERPYFRAQINYLAMHGKAHPFQGAEKALGRTDPSGFCI